MYPSRRGDSQRSWGATFSLWNFSRSRRSDVSHALQLTASKGKHDKLSRSLLACFELALKLLSMQLPSACLPLCNPSHRPWPLHLSPCQAYSTRHTVGQTYELPPSLTHQPIIPWPPEGASYLFKLTQNGNSPRTIKCVCAGVNWMISADDILNSWLPWLFYLYISQLSDGGNLSFMPRALSRPLRWRELCLLEFGSFNSRRHKWPL